MVTEIVKNENVFQSAFRALRESSPSAAWVELVRGSAIDRFELLGFPTVREEEWKYTNLAPWVKDGFSLASDSSELSSAEVAKFSYPETSASHVILVNGFFRKDL